MTAGEIAGLIQTARAGDWPDGWHAWPCTREAHLALLEEEIKRLDERPIKRGGGRGIVTCASAKSGLSSGKHLPQGHIPGAWVLFRELQRLGCRLPVTLCHIGPQEMDAPLRRLLEAAGMAVLDLESELTKRPCRILGGWESKCYAILRSSYDEVLFLDADNLPLSDPARLFDAPRYLEHGALFWPDPESEDLRDAAWLSVGLPHREERDFESGQLLIDKRRCARELNLAMWLNEHSDYFYKLHYGDKSTFHLAWRRLGTEYALVKKAPDGDGHSMLQHGPDGQLLFQHCTHNKPSLSGYAHETINAGFCADHLRELATLWPGKLERKKLR